MSIDGEIAKLVRAGSLTFLPPMFPAVSVVRDVFVSEEVLALVGDSPTVATQFERVAGRARARIDSFSAGKMFVFGLDPHRKSVTCAIARNDPLALGIVDLRVTDPNPQLRIFGGVPKPDVLLLLTWAPRRGLKFSMEVRRCRAQWDALLPTFPPIVEASHDAYFSNVIPG